MPLLSQLLYQKNSQLATPLYYFRKIFESLDHRPIKFSVSVPAPTTTKPPNYDFNCKKLDKVLFKSQIEEIIPLLQAKWNNFELNLTQDVDLAIKKLRTQSFSPLLSPVHSNIMPSHNKDLVVFRPQNYAKKLEGFLQETCKTQITHHQNEFEVLNARTTFTRAIRKVKLNFFNNKAEKINKPWELYKSVGKKHRTFKWQHHSVG